MGKPDQGWDPGHIIINNKKQCNDLHFCSALKKNGRPFGGTHPPYMCANARVGLTGLRRLGNLVGVRHIQPTPQSRPHDVCNDLSVFEHDLGDEWKNWRMDAPRWDSDGEPKESVEKKREELPPSIPAVVTRRDQMLSMWHPCGMGGHPTWHDIRGYLLPAFVNICECQMRDQFRRLWLSTRLAASASWCPQKCLFSNLRLSACSV